MRRRGAAIGLQCIDLSEASKRHRASRLRSLYCARDALCHLWGGRRYADSARTARCRNL